MRLALGLILTLLAIGLHAGCGKNVSLGAGPSAPNDAGDGPANACVAAGGKCISASATCNVPGDPSLEAACGDPGAPRCCTPLPDAGPVDLIIGGADGPADRGAAKP